MLSWESRLCRQVSHQIGCSQQLSWLLCSDAALVLVSLWGWLSGLLDGTKIRAEITLALRNASPPAPGNPRDRTFSRTSTASPEKRWQHWDTDRTRGESHYLQRDAVLPSRAYLSSFGYLLQTLAVVSLLDSLVPQAACQQSLNKSCRKMT